MFQNYVILDSNKTNNKVAVVTGGFRIMLFQIVTKHVPEILPDTDMFQNYVILDSNKTYMLTVAGWVTVLELCYFRQ